MIDDLTKRQEILYKRLESLTEKVKTKILPARIEEIWIFGSYIRGKENPKDLDVCLKYSSILPEYHEFMHLFDRMKMKIKNKSITPQEAFRQIIESESTNKNKEEWVDIFCEWIEGITWSKISRESFLGYLSNWEVVTNRVLLKGLPRVQIADIVKLNENFKIKTNTVELVWSKNNENLHENLKNVLSKENIHQNNLKELGNLENQIDEYKKKLPHIQATEKISDPNSLEPYNLSKIVEAKRKELKKIHSEYGDLDQILSGSNSGNENGTE